MVPSRPGATTEGSCEDSNHPQRCALWDRALLQRPAARELPRQEGSRDRADALSDGRCSFLRPEGPEDTSNACSNAMRPGAHKIVLCGTCMDARGLGESDLMEGAHRGSMDELAETTLAADKVMVF